MTPDRQRVVPPATSASVIALVVAVTLLAGAVNGVAGFGFALVGAMVLATVIDPAVAVDFMIVPILAVNVSLVSDLSRSQLATCVRRFAPLIASALVRTVVGMAVLEWLPAAPIRVALGVVTLSFVGGSQRIVPLPPLLSGPDDGDASGPSFMLGIGGVSGLLFGGTNVGVQLVASLRSLDLSHGLFVGVVALVFVGLNAVRVGVAGFLGLYPSRVVFAASLAAAIPALVGVSASKRVRDRVGERARRGSVLALRAFVGVRLVLGGLGVL